MSADITASGEHWLTIVVLLGTIFGAMWRVWRKQMKPKLEKLGEQSEWVTEQMTANGVARRLGTHRDTLRDALDRNTSDTLALGETLETVRQENAKALGEVAELADKRHAENQEAIRKLREGQ